MLVCVHVPAPQLDDGLEDCTARALAPPYAVLDWLVAPESQQHPRALSDFIHHVSEHHKLHANRPFYLSQ